MPTIRNVTQKDLVLVGRVLSPYKTMDISTSELLNLHSLINHNMIVVENFDPLSNQKANAQSTDSTINNQEVKTTNKEELDKVKYIMNKEKLMEAFFAFYLEKELSKEQLEILKEFYSNVGPTSSVSLKTKTLMNNVNNNEELIEVLLNHIYPEFLKTFQK